MSPLSECPQDITIYAVEALRDVRQQLAARRSLPKASLLSSILKMAPPGRRQASDTKAGTGLSRDQRRACHDNTVANTRWSDLNKMIGRWSLSVRASGLDIKAEKQ